MCQLLAMNCNVPTDIVFSFTGFVHRGGHTDTHHDGWGIAFFEGAGVRHFVELIKQMGATHAAVADQLADPASAILDIDRRVADAMRSEAYPTEGVR